MVMRFLPIAPFVLFVATSALALVSGPAGCAQGTVEFETGGGDDGDGGAGGSVSSGAGGQDAGWDGSCMTADDCASFTDACSVGACINAKCGKIPMNEGAACDDGKQCTQIDTCQSGVCVGGEKKFCPSTSSCFVGDCDVATDSCVEVPGNDGAPCVDDDACTQTGVCGNGVCLPGKPVDCSFLDGTCSKGYCDPTLGCVTMPLNDGTACNDNFYCTVNDTCKAGVCAGVPNTCAAPGDVCQVGMCNEAAKSCVAVPGNNGGACDDNNACTTGETCSNGACSGGAPANNGGACDDQDPCTVSDTCANGTCAGGAAGCQNADLCCPAGCVLANDDDCGCLNPGGGAMIADNGAGLNEQYCYNANDSTQVRAMKACESHFGVGACCVITGGYQDQQYGQCNQGGGVGTYHWHWDNHPNGHCAPIYVVGDVVSPGWCGVVLGTFIN